MTVTFGCWPSRKLTRLMLRFNRGRRSLVALPSPSLPQCPVGRAEVHVRMGMKGLSCPRSKALQRDGLLSCNEGKLLWIMAMLQLIHSWHTVWTMYSHSHHTECDGHQHDPSLSLFLLNLSLCQYPLSHPHLLFNSPSHKQPGGRAMIPHHKLS